ncbi:MAG: hypothetical protein RLY86_3406 [Pseudomonadota bacterium]|jgi:uncharacterized protein YoxC
MSNLSGKPKATTRYAPAVQTAAALENLAAKTTAMDTRLTGEIKGLRQDVDFLKQDVKELKQDVSVLKQDVGGLKQDVQGLKQGLEEVRQGQARLERIVGDNTTLVLQKLNQILGPR